MLDFWTLGVLIYELLVGRPPFKHEVEKIMLEKICSGSFSVPSNLSAEATSVIHELLKTNVGSGNLLAKGEAGKERLRGSDEAPLLLAHQLHETLPEEVQGAAHPQGQELALQTLRVHRDPRKKLCDD